MKWSYNNAVDAPSPCSPSLLLSTRGYRPFGHALSGAHWLKVFGRHAANGPPPISLSLSLSLSLSSLNTHTHTLSLSLTLTHFLSLSLSLSLSFSLSLSLSLSLSHTHTHVTLELIGPLASSPHRTLASSPLSLRLLGPLARGF